MFFPNYFPCPTANRLGRSDSRWIRDHQRMPYERTAGYKNGVIIAASRKALNKTTASLLWRWDDHWLGCDTPVTTDPPCVQLTAQFSCAAFEVRSIGNSGHPTYRRSVPCHIGPDFPGLDVQLSERALLIAPSITSFGPHRSGLDLGCDSSCTSSDE